MKRHPFITSSRYTLRVYTRSTFAGRQHFHFPDPVVLRLRPVLGHAQTPHRPLFNGATRRRTFHYASSAGGSMSLKIHPAARDDDVTWFRAPSLTQDPLPSHVTGLTAVPQ